LRSRLRDRRLLPSTRAVARSNRRRTPGGTCCPRHAALVRPASMVHLALAQSASPKRCASVQQSSEPVVAAYSVVPIAGSITSAPMERLVMPPLNAAQLAPASVLLNTPCPRVPAYRVVGAAGSMTKAETALSDKPTSDCAQLLPPSVLLETPLPPASTVVGVTGSMVVNTSEEEGTSSGVQVVPLSVLL